MKEITYNWTLKDAQFTKDKGTVFSCFSCGGGSTMGYKLAGYDVIGCNEIDPKMMSIYRENHNPKYSFCEPIQEFKKRKDLPKAYERVYNKSALFNYTFAYRDKVLSTLTAHIEGNVSFYEPRYISNKEIIKAATFPSDYNFLKRRPIYVCGMSVPPLMMYEIASNIYNQWLSKLK